MKQKNQISETVWSIIGFLILLWDIFWFVKVKVLNEYGIVRNVIMFNLGIFISVLYIISAILFSIIKKYRHKK